MLHHVKRYLRVGAENQYAHLQWNQLFEEYEKFVLAGADKKSHSKHKSYLILLNEARQRKTYPLDRFFWLSNSYKCFLLTYSDATHKELLGCTYPAFRGSRSIKIHLEERDEKTFLVYDISTSMFREEDKNLQQYYLRNASESLVQSVVDKMGKQRSTINIEVRIQGRENDRNHKDYVFTFEDDELDEMFKASPFNQTH